MNKLLTFAAAMLLSITSFAQNGKSIYQKYSEAENVSAVYISPAMFRLMGQVPDMELKDESINLTTVIKSLTGMYLISSENPGINTNLKNDVENFVKSGRYELLMEIKDDGEIVQIHTVSKDDFVTSFVLLAYEKDECTFICLDGQIRREQLEELLAQANQNNK